MTAFTYLQHWVITALDALLEWAGAALLALDELTEPE